jgi:hypothetical protein
MTRIRICGVVGLALLASGCHVSNRLYNVATDPMTGSPKAESVVRVTPGAAVPDVVDKDCDPKDHVCVAFLEFDDMGESWDKGQLPAALALVERTTAAATSQPPIVVVFVHGWKNNASRIPDHRNGNVIGFEGMLQYMQMLYPGTPVTGIYIGWRGDLIPTYWPVRRQLSYFNRERAAIRVPGASMTSAVVEIARRAHRNRPDAYALMIGHSFGALVLERALAQATAEHVLKEQAGSPGSGPAADGGWADLVVFVNSAAAANEGKQMLDLLKRNGTTVTSSDKSPRPLYLSVSSLGDAATRFALPVGHGPSFLVHKTNGTFRSYAAGDEPQPPVKAQSAYYMSTVAHMQALQSHIIVDGEACRDGQGDLVPFGAAFTLPNGKMYRVCEKRARWNDTPYWAMQMPASIVRNHSSIFTQDLVGLLTVFFPTPQEMAAPAIRPAMDRK